MKTVVLLQVCTSVAVGLYGQFWLRRNGKLENNTVQDQIIAYEPRRERNLGRPQDVEVLIC